MAENSTNPSRKAFTLVELLVVVSILAILAGFLFPVFSQAKRGGKRSACLSNLSQIGTGVMLYREDADGVFPLAVDSERTILYNWAPEPSEESLVAPLLLKSLPLKRVLRPYARASEVWRCPEDVGGAAPYNDIKGEPSFPAGLPQPAFTELGTSYAYRSELGFRGISMPGQCTTPDGLQLSDSQVGVLVDSGPDWHARQEADLTNKNRHVSFADGHVGYVSGGGSSGFVASWSTNCGTTVAKP